VVVMRDDHDALVDALLADLFIHARNCVRAFGDFHFAVSGTPEAEPFLRRLMYDLNFRDFPWVRTRLWMVDEVALPAHDERGRAAVVRGLVLEHSGIPREQFHAIDALSPTASEEYQADLRQHLGWREKGHDRLDFVLLSLTEDGVLGARRPVASAGSGGHDGVGASGKSLLVESIPGTQPPLVALTVPFINASRVIAVIASGPAVRPSVARLVADTRGSGDRTAGAAESQWPARALSPMAGELRWYLDKAACPEPPSAPPG